MAFLIVPVLILFSCTKDGVSADGIFGEWHCHDLESDIYVSFSSDGVFGLYQQIGEGRYRFYYGSWSFDGQVLSGNYSDGTGWGSSYSVSFEGSDRMTLTALNGSSEAVTYTRTSIPASVIDNSVKYGD
ncbi:MAG: hypothetical protein ACI4TM_02535 [Candidatus Cryptobacteroides sp.]